jgi:hypothetical protein
VEAYLLELVKPQDSGVNPITVSLILKTTELGIRDYQLIARLKKIKTTRRVVGANRL